MPSRALVAATRNRDHRTAAVLGAIVALWLLPLWFVILAPVAFFVLVTLFSRVGALYGYLRADTG